MACGTMCVDGREKGRKGSVMAARVADHMDTYGWDTRASCDRAYPKESGREQGKDTRENDGNCGSCRAGEGLRF